MSAPVLIIILVFAVPILAILVGGYKEWLEFKAKHQELGSSTEQVEKHLQALREDINRLEETRDDLENRIENLETIVTSEVWIAQHDEDEVDALNRPGSGALDLTPPAEDATSDTEPTAHISHRLPNQYRTGRLGTSIA